MSDEKSKSSQATKLVELASEASLFHDRDQVGYAIIKQGKHHETYRIRTKPFKHWLAGQYFYLYESTPGSQAIQDAIGTIEGHAIFHGPKREVNLRIAGDESRLVIDLGTPKWDRLLVTRNGWKHDAGGEQLFIRSRGMESLPVPRRTNHGLEIFRRFVNVLDDELPLLVGWMIGCLRPSGPYPLLAVHGEQGSAKSTTCRVCRRLIDPNKADLRSAPREERDLVISATNSWVIALENLSSIPSWLSDALCRISTGSGFATRELYSDQDEIILNVQRPILLNGIEELANRSDLIDRSIFLSLPRISENQRKVEADFWTEFNEAKGCIFGWLLDCVVTAFKNLPDTELDSYPRMADFAKWVVASETSIGWKGRRFMDAYNGNRSEANSSAIESSPIGKAILDYWKNNQFFKGTATDMLEALDNVADEKTRKQRENKCSKWPKTARAISGQLRRIAPNLRQIGIEIETDLPGRLIRLGTQPTVSTVDTVGNANDCDCLLIGSDGTNGPIHTESKNVICECGEPMTPSETSTNGRHDWDCPGCGRSKEFELPL